MQTVLFLRKKRAEALFDVFPYLLKRRPAGVGAEKNSSVET